MHVKRIIGTELGVARAQPKTEALAGGNYSNKIGGESGEQGGAVFAELTCNSICVTKAYTTCVATTGGGRSVHVCRQMM